MEGTALAGEEGAPHSESVFSRLQQQLGTRPMQASLPAAGLAGSKEASSELRVRVEAARANTPGRASCGKETSS